MAIAHQTTATARAVQLAARGLGRTSPHPMTGCAVLDTAGQPKGAADCRRPTGGPPAKACPPDAASGQQPGRAHLVTLEPYCPRPGTKSLIAAGATAAVRAATDPAANAADGAAVVPATGAQVAGAPRLGLAIRWAVNGVRPHPSPPVAPRHSPAGHRHARRRGP